jgi:hypothetical protein
MIVASRELTLRSGDGEKTVAIRVFSPTPSGSDWGCRYEIDWPDRQRAFTIHGLDAMQALILALNMIAAEIYASPYHSSGGLFWETPGAGYGFPVPESLKDMAVGEDARGA